MTVTAAPAAPPVTWTVRPGDTLSGIATAVKVHGGWPALYAANRRLIGPDPGLIRPGMTLVLPGQEAALRYVVAPGDTLSGIAAALGVRGGWPALYAANRRLVGPDPALISPGTVLTVPPPSAKSAPAGPGEPQAPSSPAAPGQPRPHGTEGGTPPAQGTPATGGATGAASPGPASPGSTPAATPASPGGTPAARGTRGAPQADGVMPQWLKATLLVVALLVLTAFVAPPAAAAGQRRRRALREHAAARRHDRDQRTARKMARFVQADHERLIVTYSVSDDTVYLLTPPGEDPRAVLRAARLVLPEDTYQDLAGHLGAPPGWQGE